MCCWCHYKSHPHFHIRHRFHRFVFNSVHSHAHNDVSTLRFIMIWHSELTSRCLHAFSSNKESQSAPGHSRAPAAAGGKFNAFHIFKWSTTTDHANFICVDFLDMKFIKRILDVSSSSQTTVELNGEEIKNVRPMEMWIWYEYHYAFNVFSSVLIRQPVQKWVACLSVCVDVVCEQKFRALQILKKLIMILVLCGLDSFRHSLKKHLKSAVQSLSFWLLVLIF